MSENRTTYHYTGTLENIRQLSWAGIVFWLIEPSGMATVSFLNVSDKSPFCHYAMPVNSWLVPYRYGIEERWKVVSDEEYQKHLARPVEEHGFGSE